MQQFFCPTKLVTTDDVAADIGSIVDLTQLCKVAFLVDDSLGDNGVVKELIQTVHKSVTETAVIEIRAQEPDTDMVDEYAGQLRGQGVDFLVGIGGGSVLDLAKAVAALASNPGKAAEYQGKNLVPRPGCLTMMIPSTAGTGSEASPGSVVVNRATKRKGAISSPYIRPTYAVLDARLTLSMPGAVTAATGMDALAHAVESFTARCATPVTQMFSREGFRLISGSLPLIFSDPKNIELRRRQLLGSSLACMGATNSDTGASHAMSYPMGIYFGIPHGVANALLLPHIISTNIEKGARQYAELYDLLPEANLSLPAGEKCRRFSDFVQNIVPGGTLPGSLKHYGVASGDLPFLAERGLDLKSALTNNPVEFTGDDAAAVLARIY